MWHECGLDETIRTVDYDFIEIIRIWHDGRPTVVMMICSISLSNVASCSSAPASFGMTQLLDDSEIRSSHIPSFIFRRIYHCITQHAISRQIEKKTTRMTMWCWEIYMLIMEFALTGPLWLLSADCGFALTCFGQKCSLIFCFVGVFLSSFLHMSINMGHLWYERMTNGSHIHQNMDDEIRLFRR